MAAPRLSEELGRAGGHGSHLLLLDDLTDADQVSIRVDDGELAKSPRLVLQRVHPWDTSAGQLARQTRPIEILDIHDSDVAAGGRLCGHEFTMGEKVQLNGASSQNGVPAIHFVGAALETKTPEERDGVDYRAARQYRNRKIE